jgi:TRAP-type C4-dicarboxylate transport system permease small subunit
MKKQMKTNLFTAALGLVLFGTMLSSSTGNGAATTANQAPTLQGLPLSTPATATPASIPFTVYLSLCTAFTNGKSIDFNAMDEDGQTSILDKMTNWKEGQ